MKLRKSLIYSKVLILIGIMTMELTCESTEELADFDFESPIINNENLENFEYYDDDDDDESESDDLDDHNDYAHHQNNPYNVKEKFLRTTLSKALTNKALRQKFVEVIPILRVLSSQQRLALSALISAQINAKPGTELKLDQVRSMFGNNKKLILPLVFDIANLVRNAAKSTLHYQYELFPGKHSNDIKLNQTSLSRRNIKLDERNIEDEIDAKTINNELTRNISPNEILKIGNRSKRSVYLTSPQYILPSSTSAGFHERKLNISSFSQPAIDKRSDNTEPEPEPDIEPESESEYELNPTNDELQFFNKTDYESSSLTFDQVEDLALANLNGTSDENQDNINFNQTNDDEIEALPIPESLISGPRIRKIGNNNKIGIGGNSIRKSQKRLPIRPRVPVHPVTSKSCERFTPSMCIRANDYPTDQIMGSIRRHKHAMSALLAEYRDKAAELEYQEYLEELNLNDQRRREDQNEVTPGGMCSSIIRYARPQKARSASGEWKFIVNTGQHTQTLRLEKCSNPHDSCSYLSDNYRSRCIQVYNYHRLLSWDKNRGLHVDIFKIPTCCSCHVDGYRDSFPPLGGSSSKLHDYQPIKNHNSVNNEYSHLNEAIDYEEVDDDDDDDDDDIDVDEGESVAYQFSNGFNRIIKPKSNKYDTSDFLQLSSSNVKSNYDHHTNSKKRTSLSLSTTTTTSPTLGTYLSPPHFNNNNKYRGSSRQRRPIINSYLENVDDRSDQDQSGTSVDKEVTVYPTSEKTSIPSKRKRIYSVSTVKTTKFTPSIRYTSPAPLPYANYNSRKKTTIKPTNYATSIQSSTITTSNDTISTTKHTRTPSLFSTKLTNVKVNNNNNNNNKNDGTNNNKRINYNYHPIIDFFEDGSSSLSPSALPKNYIRSPNLKLKSSSAIKDSRIGLGTFDDTNWHPLI